MFRVGDRVKFRSSLQHGRGIVKEVFGESVVITTIEVYNNLNDKKMVVGYSKMLYFSQVEKIEGRCS